VARRYTLETIESGRTGVIASVGGAPWIVRAGNLVLLGSRIDPEWTGLPLSAGFVPFMDALLNRIARGELTVSAGHPDEPVALPDLVTSVLQGNRQWVVEGGAPFRPGNTGIYFLLAGRDTIGALAVNFDPGSPNSPGPRTDRCASCGAAQFRFPQRGSPAGLLPRSSDRPPRSGALGRSAAGTC
jgi:hypothetical protein